MEVVLHVATDASKVRARPTLATTAFGQQLFLLWPRPLLGFSYFGHDLLWPRPSLATPTLATARRLWPRSVFAFFETEEAGGGPKGPERSEVGDPKGGGPEGWGTRRVGGPKGGEGPKGGRGQKVGGPKGGWEGRGEKVGGGHKGWGEPEISRFFFFLLPLPFSFFFLSPDVFSCIVSSLKGSSRGILVGFGRSGPQMCLFTPSGCPVKPRRPGSRGGLPPNRKGRGQRRRGQIRLNLLWQRPSLATAFFGNGLLWPRPGRLGHGLSPRGLQAAGVSQDNRGRKQAHSRSRPTKTHQNSTRRPPVRGKIHEKTSGERRKRREDPQREKK